MEIQMLDYIPPDSFTADVMKQVKIQHIEQQRSLQWLERATTSRIVRIAALACATGFGILNLARIFLSLFSPVLCR